MLFGMVTPDVMVEVQAQQRNGNTVIAVGSDAEVWGLIAIADTIRPEAQKALRDLRASGYRLALLTGDNEHVARALAKDLGLDDVRAELLPQDKVEAIRDLQKRYGPVAMIGDGINDAPALAEASVGIAMGTGTDIAMNSARIVLVKGDLRGIVKARQLSRATMRNIRQNLFFAFAYNFVGVPIAAGVLYPWLGLLLSPMIASAAMSLSSVSVIANALRLRRASL
jgi:P-type E1-E2 ATPase